jgi:hypothetical protein
MNEETVEVPINILENLITLAENVELLLDRTYADAYEHMNEDGTVSFEDGDIPPELAKDVLDALLPELHTSLVCMGMSLDDWKESPDFVKEFSNGFNFEKNTEDDD